MNEKLICLLKAAKVSAENYRSSGVIYADTRERITEHIEELKAAINAYEGAKTLASYSQEAQGGTMKDDERGNDHLIHALHDVSKELVRATGEIRSLLVVLSKLDLINLEKINMKVSELSGGLNEVKASTLKAFSEIRNRIDAADARIVVLEKSLSDADIPAEAETALADLKTIAKQLDDIVPDAPELPPVVNPPTPA